MGKLGLPRIATFPARARFEFGGARRGDVRSATDITAGNAGAKGNSAAIAVDADIPVLLRKGALRSPWRAAGLFSRNSHVEFPMGGDPPQR